MFGNTVGVAVFGRMCNYNLSCGIAVVSIYNVYGHIFEYDHILICQILILRSGSRIVRRPLRRSSTVTAVDSLSP